MLMNDEKRMIGNYAVEQSIHIGKKEVVFCVDKRAEHPYVVCYCDYNNPFSAISLVAMPRALIVTGVLKFTMS